MELYRYDNPSGHTSVRLKVFIVVRETEKSLWIVPKPQPPYSEHEPKRIGRDGLRPFASKTKEAALVEFVRRRGRQIFLLKSKLETAELVQDKAKHMLENIGEIQNGEETS